MSATLSTLTLRPLSPTAAGWKSTPERYVMTKAALATFTAALITSAGLAGIRPANASPDAPTCADIGAVFVAQGTDGRGDCMSADPRPKCHVPPNQQDAFDPTGN
jgi:hypothetical protein